MVVFDVESSSTNCLPFWFKITLGREKKKNNINKVFVMSKQKKRAAAHQGCRKRTSRWAFLFSV